MFYDTRSDKKYYRVLLCVISKIIKFYACIDYLVCRSKHFGKIPVGSGGGSKHGYKRFDIILGIGIPYLLMNLISCH